MAVRSHPQKDKIKTRKFSRCEFKESAKFGFIISRGLGGIRIEDDVVVQQGRGEVLTRASRDFIEL